MRPRLEHSRDRLAVVLGRQPAVSARELVAQGLFGAELGKALAEQRLQALKRYKQAFSLPTAPPA